MSEFESFVNLELPKRIATNEDPLSVPANKVFVTTGVGLLTELRDYVAGGGQPALTRTAANDINGHTVVRVFGSYAYEANRILDASSRIALATNAAVTGDPVNAVIVGEVIESSWSWVPGPIFWVDGGLAQVIPETGPIVKVGTALSETSMFVFIHQPIMRN